MIIIKKKKTNIIARIIALIGVICVIFTAFALPSFAWGNSIENAEYVHSTAPFYAVEYVRYTSSGNSIGSTYATNNYFNINNRNGYSPSFPQTQTSGVMSVTLTEHDLGIEGSTHYLSRTLFDPSYYGEGIRGYLNLEVEDIFIGNNNFCSMVEALDGTYLYVLPSLVIEESGVDPDFSFLPQVFYRCSYIVKEDGLTSSVSREAVASVPCSSVTFENLIMYDIYSDMLENSPENTAFIYVDHLEVSTAGMNIDQTAKVGYLSTYYIDYTDAYSSVNFAELLSSASGDSSALQAEISRLESINSSLTMQNDSLISENTYLESQNDSLRGSNADLNDRVSELTSAVAGKNDEILSIKKENAIVLEEKNNEILKLEQKNFELRNTSGVIEEYFNGISSALWNGLSEISDIGYSYVNSDGVTQNVTIGNLITVTVIGAVAFFVIKLLKGG